MDPDPNSILFLSIFKPWNFNVLFGLALMAVLLFISAMISGSEVAYFALSPQDKERLESEKSHKSEAALELLSKPKTLLATILIGNNLVNVGIVILSSMIMDILFNFQDRALLAFMVQVISVTLIILIIGEISPKVYATKQSYNIALLTAYPLRFMRKIFYPLSQVLVRTSKRIDERARETDHGGHITVDELSQALELTTEFSEKTDEKRILSGIVKFGSTEVRQVMTPRIDVIGIDKSLSYSKLRNSIVEHGFSRVPVYTETFDQVDGVLYVKDLLPYLSESENFEWQKLLRPASFVTENKKLDDLLREFQETKNHMSIVVDEYGGSSGLITLEDIIEEIVGEISDEFDVDEIIYSKLDDKNYVFEGKTALMDMYRILNIDGKEFEADKGDSDSIAGFILELSGKIPQKNERIRFNQYQFTIEAADKRRIKQVKVTILEDELA